MKKYSLWVEETAGANPQVIYRIRGDYNKGLPQYTFNSTQVTASQKEENLTLCGKALAGEVYKALKFSKGNDKIRIDPGCDTSKTYGERMKGTVKVKLRTPSFDELTTIEEIVRSELRQKLTSEPINGSDIDSILYAGNWYFL